MLIPPPPLFKSLRERNELYGSIQAAIGLCATVEDLELLKLEYKEELGKLQKHDEQIEEEWRVLPALLLKFELRQQFIELEKLWL